MQPSARDASASRPDAPVERDELLLLADLTLAEFARHLARHGGTVLEEDGLVLFAGPHPQPNPYRNGALRLDGRLDGEEVLRRSRAFFAARQSGHVVWVREHADAEQAGLREIERLPELVLENLPEERPPAEGIELRRTLDEQTRRDYLKVVAEAWGMGDLPLEVAAQVFFHPDSAAAPNLAAFVAYDADGVPLAGSMALVSHGAALGTQGGTIPSARRRGLGQSTLWASLRVAFEELGAQRSVCQTSSTGLPAWTGMGYVPFTGYRRFLVPARAPGA